MAPGDVAHVPRTPSPVAEAGPVAEHFRSRARLRRLLVRLRRPTPSTPALRATPGGLRSLRSASSLPFLVTCRRQVIPSHSFAARTRACCAPRKRYCGLICALRKWLYRPPRYLARAGTLACAPGSGTLRPHPVSDLAARVNGFADQPSLACTGCPHAPPEGHWRAHPAAAPCRRTRYRTLPPLCVIERREERGCRVAPLPRGGQGGGEEPPALRRRGSGHLSAKKREDAQSGRCPAGPRLPGLIGSITV